ncbi:hypothetical protein KJ885_05005, partial [Patescibacteria group bacterium]|nr:hypothetical protein [Patescibacteria group bacterium]
MKEGLPELDTNLGGNEPGSTKFGRGKPAGGDEFSEKQLKLGYWFITHKVLLRKILTGVLMGIAGIFWIYALVGFVDWAFVRGPKERENLKTTLQIITAPEALQAISAQDISFTEPVIFAGGIGQYDILVQAKNTNEKWWAEFKYRFVGEGLNGDWLKGFILPNETKYIANLGVQRAFRPRNVRFETDNFKYHRINPHEIADYAKWEAERLNIAISDKKFDPYAIRNKKNIASLTFKASNNSAYDFWSVGFYAFLYRGEQLVATNYISTTEFLSGEEKDLQMQFYEGLPTITKYEIIPDLNIFD